GMRGKVFTRRRNDATRDSWGSRRGVATLRNVFWLALFSLLAAPSPALAQDDDEDDPRPPVVVWHAYRAAEADAIELWAKRVNEREQDLRVQLLKVPYDAFLDKITAAIPRGKGPDVFIAAHDTIGDWAEAKTISPLDDVVDP